MYFQLLCKTSSLGRFSHLARWWDFQIGQKPPFKEGKSIKLLLGEHVKVSSNVSWQKRYCTNQLKVKIPLISSNDWISRNSWNFAFSRHENSRRHCRHACGTTQTQVRNPFSAKRSKAWKSSITSQTHHIEAAKQYWGSLRPLTQPHNIEVVSEHCCSLPILRQPHHFLAASPHSGSLTIFRQPHYIQAASPHSGSHTLLTHPQLDRLNQTASPH